MYGERVLSSKVGEWKFDEKDISEKFLNGFIKILGVVAEELSLKDFGGIDVLIYTGVIEDEFMGWMEAVYSCFYVAIMAIMTNNKPIESTKLSTLLKQLSVISENLVDQPQLLNYKHGHFTEHFRGKNREIALPENMNLVMAHSLTPLPKKLIQGKRFNLRRCEILIALEYLKNSAGTTK